MQDFERAVAEATEIEDRRAGRKPATDFQPLDFREEAPEYDADLVVMAFDERFPPVTSAEALDAAEVVAALRRQARLFDGEHRTLKDAERLAVWCRFHTAPESVQKKMLPSRGALLLTLATK